MLLTFIPYFVDADGEVWLDQLWHQDFQEHMAYLRSLTLAAPSKVMTTQKNLCRVHVPSGCQLSFAPLPSQDSLRTALVNLPATVVALMRAIKKADIVHSGVVGWPYPLGWIANPIALLMRKKLFIVIESSPWDSDDAELKRQVRSRLMKTLARWAVNHADLVAFTHAGYRKELMTRGTGAVLISPATWIAQEQILPVADAIRRWESLSASRLRVLFAGRLTRDKGVDLLIAAIRTLADRGVSMEVDIIGEGTLREECDAVARSGGSVTTRVLAPVPYGDPFFSLLRDYHAVIVPSVTNEQPRIVFDALSQGVALFASDTDGLKSCVDDGVTGQLFRRADVHSMAAVLERYAKAPQDLRKLGMQGLTVACGFTHRAMHQRRRDVLIATFGCRSLSPKANT